MRSSSGNASIWCIFFHQLQPRDSMAPITRGLPNGHVLRRYVYHAIEREIMDKKNTCVIEEFLSAVPSLHYSGLESGYPPPPLALSLSQDVENLD